VSVLPIQASDAAVPDDAVVHAAGIARRDVVGLVDRHAMVPAISSSEELLIAILALFNESTDIDVTLGVALTMLTAALDGRIGEIWLRDGAARNVELHYSSSDGAADVAAFEARGRALGLGTGPALVSRVVRTGRGSAGASVVAAGKGGRVAEAAAAGIHGAVTFPIRGSGSMVGVLVVFREPSARPDSRALASMTTICHHLARFIERTRAEAAVQAAAVELAALASTDALTGLKNRREFDRALRTIPRLPFAVLSVDVDRLKDINDSHGHAAGDALLRVVGHTLGLLVRGWDVMARIGGDEFAALLPEIGVFGAQLVAERMRVAMHSLVLATGPVRITVGWSAAPAGADPASVWQRADEYLYHAKRAGGDRIAGASYEGGEAADIAERSYSDVVTRLLEGGSITTMFQPIVSLDDGEVMGYEALARPEGFAAMDSVEQVFEAARLGGQIRDLDWLCRRRAVEEAMRLPADKPLFLNISAAALLDPIHGVDQLLLLLSNAGRAPTTVVLEITEHERIRDYDILARVLASYRAEGIRFALDDVGEGHSTLELLAASSSEFLKQSHHDFHQGRVTRRDGCDDGVRAGQRCGGYC
jgi:diguanylate cyclase (GGDEF)-like protein